jgi:hypothetical protein
MWTLFMAMNGDPGGMQPLFDAYPGTLVFAVLALELHLRVFFSVPACHSTCDYLLSLLQSLFIFVD